MRLMPVGWIVSFLTLAAAARGEEPAAVPPPAPQIAAGAWRPVFQGHSRLLGPKEHLQAMAKAKPDQYKSVKATNSLLAVGITHAVEGVPHSRIDPLVAAAMKTVEQGPTNLHQTTWIALNEVAETYDFFHDEIPAAQRRAMIDFLNAHLEKYTDDENAFHNSTLSKILVYLRIAYATRDENPRAGEFRDYAIKRLYEGRVLPVLLQFGAGGGFTEAGWYARGSLWSLVEGLELARRLEGYDGFQKAPRFFYQRLAYELFQPYPGLGEYGNELYPVEGDGSNVYGGHREYPRHMRTLLAQYFRGSPLAGYVSAKHRKASNPEAAAVDFLYEEQPNKALDLGSFPLAHCAAGIGKVYARSNWTDDATWLRFECGPFWTNHQHYEAGNFEIFRYEPLATESSEYVSYSSSHDVNWLIRTIAHNCILVYQPGETWRNLRDGDRNPHANDGGQTNAWRWPVATLDDWNKHRDAFDRAKLVAYDNRPGYMFVAGDCTRAYAPSKLSLCLRQIVFLRPSTLVIFDRVVSTRPDYHKTWLLHMKNEPEIEANRVTITAGKGRLISETLLPEKATIRKDFGYAYAGQTFPVQESVLTPAAAKWRIEVAQSPTAQTAKEDLFLHVLFTGEPQPTHLIRAGRDVGVRVGPSEVIFTGQVGGRLKLNGQQHPLVPQLKLGESER
jgi:hypothetical protein